MIKKVLISIIIITIIWWVYTLITGNIIVFNISSIEQKNLEKLSIGDAIRPFKDFNFKQGSWKACLVISRDDYSSLNKLLKKSTYFKTTDIKILEKMKKSWTFIYKESDVATVTSYICLFKDGKLVFESGIVLDETSEGLQGSAFGWVEPIKEHALIETCKKFQKTYLPIVIL